MHKTEIDQSENVHPTKVFLVDPAIAPHAANGLFDTFQKQFCHRIIC
jgi:hypothetical protein